MADKSNPSHENEHQGFFERIFHHHEGNKAGNKDKNVDPQNKTDSQRPQGEQKGEVDKLKDYLHKDEQLEEEGHEYADLM